MTNMNLKTESRNPTSKSTWKGGGSLAIILMLLHAGVCLSPAGTVLEPWVPLFKGIEHAVGTNTPGGGGFAELQVVYFLRVDLTDPDIQLFASPPIPTNYSVNFRETRGYTTTNFLKNNNLQIAINANSFFLPGSSGSPSYTVAEGSAFNTSGLCISQGVLVSPQSTYEDSAAVIFTTNKTASIIPTNWPAGSTEGIYTAVSGLYPILVDGVNVGSNYLGNPAFVHGLQPRTVFGLSQDRRYLFLLAIDGRQGSLDYSVGAYDWQSAAWLLLAGARDGVNMDGGGSTCMVVSDTTGQPIPLNHDSASLVGPGYRERTVGCQFGVYASPLPGFFNEVTALPDDTTATITWTTISPATTQLKYGLTTNMPLVTSSNSALVTNHAVLLTNLSPNTGYYFQALGSTGANQYVSSNYFCVTTNYVTAGVLFDVTNNWKYTSANLDAVNWKARNYNDTAWEGAGDGLLWVDIRGPNGEIPAPLGTQMPEDFNTGYPFTTYYFRTHFNFTNQLSGVTLQFEDYLDDGAVFYLNGAEIHRVRMPDAPTAIYNATLASTYPCSGDATCPDTFSLSGPLITTNLLAGDNVLAVEVHNNNPGSPDATFGLSAAYTVPYTLHPTLSLAQSNNAVILNWSQGGFTLQQANAPTGAWADVPGPVISSPFTTNHSSAAQFFRLRK
jgi:hypothetical protein